MPRARCTQCPVGDGPCNERAGEYLVLDGFRVCPRRQVLPVAEYYLRARLVGRRYLGDDGDLGLQPLM